MNPRALAVLVIVAIVGFSPASSEPALKIDTTADVKARIASLRTWFEHFKTGLEESVLSDDYQKRDVTAVAAVRGAAQEAAEPDKVYWKGSPKAKRAAEMKKQKAELAADLEKILAGNIKEGVAGLDAFEKAHPKSSLLAEARQARQKAKELESVASGN